LSQPGTGGLAEPPDPSWKLEPRGCAEERETMKVVCNRNALADAVSLLTAAIDTRSTRPILQCLRMQTGDEGLTLLATDLELGLRCLLKEVEVVEPGETVASAAKLSGIVHQVEDATVSLHTADDHLIVTAPGARFTLYTFDPEEYPPVAPRGEGKKFQATAGLLTALASQTVYAAAKATTRYAINGLHLAAHGNHVSMVGTDGHRLARAAGILPAKAADDVTCIVPAKAVSLVERLSTDPDTLVNVLVTDSQIAFETATTVLLANLVEGNFPSYEAVIPKDGSTKVKADRVKLLSAIRRAALMTSKESNSVKLTIGYNRMTVEARVPEQGEATVELPVETEGESLEISFNPEYLTDPLRVLAQDEIALEFKGPTTAALLRSGPDFLYVLMPVTSS